MAIKNFSQYLIEEEREVYFTFGRMNPPTIGHGKVMDTLAAKSGKADYKVYVSQTQNAKKDPLSYSDKVKHARKMFPKHARNIMVDKSVRTAIEAAVSLYNQGYRKLTMVVGDDRIREFDVLLNKYNGKDARHGFYNFKSIRVISAGKRDPDAEGVEGMSASKQRANAQNNDFVAFSQGVPKGMSNTDARKLFNDVRKGMGLKEETSFKRHIELMPVSVTREEYVKGNLYELGDTVVVKESEEIGIVSVLGANYVIVECADGRKLRKWLDGVELVEKTRTAQDPDVEGKPGTQPKNYYKGVKKKTKASRAAHFRKHGKMDDNNPAAYKPAPGDAKAKTKPSTYTKQFKAMYGEDTGIPTLDDIIKRLGPKTWQKKEYEMAKKALKGVLVRKGKEAKHSPEYYAAQILKTSGLKLDARVLAKMVAEAQAQMEQQDPVKQARASIEREKEQDKAKHDRILDRARLARARAKNRETK